jgi:hypothetical protein
MRGVNSTISKVAAPAVASGSPSAATRRAVGVAGAREDDPTGARHLPTRPDEQAALVVLPELHDVATHQRVDLSSGTVWVNVMTTIAGRSCHGCCCQCRPVTVRRPHGGSHFGSIRASCNLGHLVKTWRLKWTIGHAVQGPRAASVLPCKPGSNDRPPIAQGSGPE